MNRLNFEVSRPQFRCDVLLNAMSGMRHAWVLYWVGSCVRRFY